MVNCQFSPLIFFTLPSSYCPSPFSVCGLPGRPITSLLTTNRLSLTLCHFVIFLPSPFFHFGDLGTRSSAKGVREAPRAPRVYGVEYMEGRPSLHWGGMWDGSVPLPIFFILGSRNAYFGAFYYFSESPTHLSVCFRAVGLYVQFQTSSTRLPPLIFQADCGSVKGAGVSSEEGTEHYLPWWWIRDKFNHCQRENTESRRQLHVYFHSFSSEGHELGAGHEPLAPLDPPLYTTCHFFSLPPQAQNLIVQLKSFPLSVGTPLDRVWTLFCAEKFVSVFVPYRNVTTCGPAIK